MWPRRSPRRWSYPALRRSAHPGSERSPGTPRALVVRLVQRVPLAPPVLRVQPEPQAAGSPGACGGQRPGRLRLHLQPVRAGRCDRSGRRVRHQRRDRVQRRDAYARHLVDHGHPSRHLRDRLHRLRSRAQPICPIRQWRSRTGEHIRIRFGVQQTAGEVIVALSASNVLTLRNHSSAAAVTLQTPAGGTQANVNASMTIQRLPD